MYYIIFSIMIILWFAMAAMMMAEIAPFITKLNFWQNVILALLVFIGTPFLFIARGFEAILDYFLEEGWNDGDDDDKYGF